MSIMLKTLPRKQLVPCGENSREDLKKGSKGLTNDIKKKNTFIFFWYILCIIYISFLLVKIIFSK